MTELTSPGGRDERLAAIVLDALAEAQKLSQDAPGEELAELADRVRMAAMSYGQSLAADLIPPPPPADPVGGDVAAAALLAAASAGGEGVLERAASYVPWLLTTAARPREEG